MKLLLKILAGIGVGIVIAFVFAYVSYRQKYPYGASHCCDIGLQQLLYDYAVNHAGNYPSGAGTSEAALSLLYKDYPDAGYLLGGKTVPREKALARLKAGLPLDDKTCDWHYVEGLRIDDPQEIALFWDKIGLDHNGGVLPEGGHTVLYVTAGRREISEAHWPAFLAEQEKLLKQVKTKRAQEAAAAKPGATAKSP